MVTMTIGRHTARVYDSIDDLPVARFHKYQKLLLIDAGVGADIAAFDRRTDRAQRFLAAGDIDKARQEFENLRQCVYLIQAEVSPRHRAFAALVAELDGRSCDDLSDEALDALARELGDVPDKEVTASLEAVQKKIDAELEVYFPRIFGGSEVKEYFDILRRRTLEVLRGIAAGERNPDRTDEAERLTTALVTYSNPDCFTGSAGVEVRFDRQFEDLCLALSEHLHVEPKGCSVLAFYNAFDLLQERARAQQRGRKG